MNKWSVISRGAAQEWVHLIKEVTERTRREIDHHNFEFEWKCDRAGGEFKSISGKVLQGKTQISWMELNHFAMATSTSG